MKITENPNAKLALKWGPLVLSAALVLGGTISLTANAQGLSSERADREAETRAADNRAAAAEAELEAALVELQATAAGVDSELVASGEGTVAQAITDLFTQGADAGDLLKYGVTGPDADAVLTEAADHTGQIGGISIHPLAIIGADIRFAAIFTAGQTHGLLKVTAHEGGNLSDLELTLAPHS